MLMAYFDYHRWAMKRLLALCEGLSDEQLDMPRPIGPGSLRGVLFHLLAAERHWMLRWKGEPTGPFPTDPAGISLEDLRAGFAAADQERVALLEREAPSGFTRIVRYVHASGVTNEQPLGETLMHVANHAIHHRAQALQFLKVLGRTTPGGLDYIFYKIAHPSTPQPPETLETLRSFGLQVDGEPTPPLPFEKERLRRYFAYGDWVILEIISAAKSLEPPRREAWLDRDYSMGVGTPRKTLLHMLDAETWWLRNWTIGDQPYEMSPETTSLEEIESRWREHAAQRNAFLASQDADSAQGVVVTSFSGNRLHFRVAESMLQLCCHGAHHRAQLRNMLRQEEGPPVEVDYINWLRRNSPFVIEAASQS